jgi:predicted RNA-binding Zn ribbon-like protein
VGKDNSAPGTLEFVRQFANTFDPERPEKDPFLVFESAGAWLQERAIATGFREESVLESLRRLRSELMGTLLEHTSGSEGPNARRLSHLLDGASVRVAFGGLEASRLAAPEATTYEVVRGMIAGAVFEAQVRGTWRRLKACRKHSCLFAFYDRSKNGSGTWCDMDTCGNQVKAERRRARERAIHSD